MPTQTTLSRVESFPFDSRADGYDSDGYPVYDRAVGAAMLRMTFSKFFTDGVFPSPGDALEISRGSGLTVVIKPGVFIINGAMGGSLTDSRSLTLDTTAPQGNVCYGIMLRYDENERYRSCFLRVVRGDASSTPQPPAPDTSTPGVMEYRLGYVTVPSGATDLTGATITNEKGLDACPYAAPFVDLDLSGVVADAKDEAQQATTAFLTYVQQYYDIVASALDGTTAGELQEQINAISPAGFVDNITLSLNTAMKMQVANGGISTEKIAQGAVTSEKASSSMFTDDPDSTADSDDKVAATPAFVRSFVDSDKQSRLFIGQETAAPGDSHTMTSSTPYNFTASKVSHSGGVTVSAQGFTPDSSCTLIIGIRGSVSGSGVPYLDIRANGSSLGEFVVRGDYMNLAMATVDAGDLISFYSGTSSTVTVLDLVVQGV